MLCGAEVNTSLVEWPSCERRREREGLERRAGLALAVGGEVEGLPLEVEAADHRQHAAGLLSITTADPVGSIADKPARDRALDRRWNSRSSVDWI